MKCDRIQEFILTDYLDGQMSPLLVKNVEEHLASCSKCREFLAASRQISIEPFSKIPKISLPKEEMWLNIKQRIESDREQAHRINPFANIISKLREGIVTPRPQIFFAMVVVVILLTSICLKSINQEKMVQAPVVEAENKYLVYVANEVSVNQSEDNDDYGTAIEEYFL